MDRRVLGLLAVVSLGFLAGCSPDTTIYVYPEVNEIQHLADDSYQLNVTVDPDLDNVDTTVSDVTVHGYTLSGEPVCTLEYGSMTGPESRTADCSGFPSLLISDTPDRGDEVSADGSADSFHIETAAVLFHGDQPDRRDFEPFTRLGDRGRSQIEFGEDGPVPSASALQTMQCLQWRAQRDGADFGLVNDAPWLEWERNPPNTSRSYDMIVWNYTRLRQLDQTDRFDITHDERVYSVDEIPEVLRQHIPTTHVQRGRTPEIDRATFRAILGSLSGRNVTSPDDVSAAFDGIHGPSGQFDNTRIDCTNTPHHAGKRGQYGSFFVSDEDVRWVVDIRTEQAVSGPAFHNDTAP